MGKGHRDNHAARKKRGPGAFAKKKERRTFEPKCPMCGGPARDLSAGICIGCQRMQQGLNRDGTPRT